MECPRTTELPRQAFEKIVFPPRRPRGYFPIVLWLNGNSMFARKIRVQYEKDGLYVACPLKWLDSFSMRNFTNASVFDDTLPISDGVLEIGTNVPLDQLKAAMEDWFRRKGFIGKETPLEVSEP